MIDDERERRLAFNEVVARDVNRFVDEVASGWYDRDEEVEFRCECSRQDCDARIRLTRDEYISAHEDPLVLVLAAGHENLEIEEVAGHVREYVLARKVGAGAEVARGEVARGEPTVPPAGPPPLRTPLA